jgi:hypothetical protein
MHMRRWLPAITIALFLTFLAAPSAQALGGWLPSAHMAASHTFASAVRLLDGRALVAGGNNNSTAEVYDPQIDRWSFAGDLLNRGGSLTLLNDGTVLLAGGGVYGSPTGIINNVFRYNPQTNTWAEVAPMHAARIGHQATLLGNGKLLVTGGTQYLLPTPVFTNTTELYNPTTNQWTPAAPMNTPRSGHAAVWLPSGKLVVIGGDASGTSVELYDPEFNTWTPATPMPTRRSSFTATWLPNNAILVVGDGTADLYYPPGDHWSTTPPMLTARTGATHTASLLPSGQVLIAGGAYMSGESRQILAAAELYDWRTGLWTATAPMSVPREGHIAAALGNFQLLVAGGYSDGGRGPLPQGGANGVDLASAERYGEVTTPERCFPQTNHCVRGLFLRYWQAHGGLAINGYPLSDEFAEQLEDGKAYIVQYFERVRMEYHPENQPPYDVLLGQFGRRIHPADPPAAPIGGAHYFGETAHNLRGTFLRYWQRNGGLAQFGYPLSEEFSEVLEDGQTYVVQYFERARFEHHPENRPPYDVLLGQFGRRILGER